jgi:hypothetical protein
MEHSDTGAQPEPTGVPRDAWASRDRRTDPPWGAAQGVDGDYRPGSVAFPRDDD